MSNKTLKQFEAWHKSRAGLLIFGVAELLIAYIIGSRAIDTGSIWEYALAIVFLVGGIQNIVRLIGTLVHGKRS